MNLDPSSNEVSPPDTGGPVGIRKERGAIAAQACETCRSRKQKCDEQRPKCSTCYKFNLECRYREPQPTKKDKTLLEILDRIKTIEGKLDAANLQGTPSSSIYDCIQRGPKPTEPQAQPQVFRNGGTSPFNTTPCESTSVSPYRYVSPAYRVLAWPYVRQILALDSSPGSSASSRLVELDGPSVLLQLQSLMDPLPTYGIGPKSLHSMTVEFQSHFATPTGGPPMDSEDFDRDILRRLATAYFDTFNLLYPILERQAFENDVLPIVLHEGFNEQPPSTLACLVFALGAVALSTPSDAQTEQSKQEANSPHPGLPFFNEARKRMGFVIADSTIESTQTFALSGLYYESCCRPVEAWRMTTAMSMTCQAFLSSKPQELRSPRADLIRRLYWHCSIMETYFHLELELPPTGLERFQALVGLPDFSGMSCESDYVGNQTSHYQEHFASQIVLRRLSMDFNDSLRRAACHTAPENSQINAISSFPTVARHNIRQLDKWRGLLPSELRWQDGQTGGLSATPHEIHDQSPYQLPLYSPSTVKFTSDLESPTVPYPFALDVQVALLRTRYHYTKYLVYRPFIYKAVHHAELMTQEDAEYAAEGLKTCLKWPITMSPTCRNKRLIPSLFYWSQNVLGILIILYISQQSPMLIRIRETLCGPNFGSEASETVSLYLAWLEDLKRVDPMAKWACTILNNFYPRKE